MSKTNGISVKEAWNSVSWYSEEFSKLGRQGSYAGIATFWVISDLSPSTDFCLIVSLFLFLLFLFFDAVQMLTAFFFRKRWVRKREIERAKNYVFDKNLDRVPFCLFRLKATAFISAFILLSASVIRLFFE